MSRWNPDAIERQLAHMEENEVRWAYMHAAEFWNERVEMMQVWADYLDQLRYGRQWMHRYDHSRTLTAENSPLKAETGVRFPLAVFSQLEEKGEQNQ